MSTDIRDCSLSWVPFILGQRANDPRPVRFTGDVIWFREVQGDAPIFPAAQMLQQSMEAIQAFIQENQNHEMVGAALQAAGPLAIPQAQQILLNAQNAL